MRPRGPLDVAVLSVLYSPGHYTRPVLNLLLVENRLEAAGIPFFKLEVAWGDDPHVLPAGPRTLHLRTRSCMFQKERLMNVLEASVPANFSKVLFLDADVMLADTRGGHWYDSLSQLLDSHDVVQPFDLAGHLDLSFKRVSNIKCSVLYAYKGQSLDSQIRRRNLHTGLAWAFRRDWLQQQGGLFDLAIHGGGDSVNAGAVGKLRVCMPEADGLPDPECLGGAGRIMVPAYAAAYQTYVDRVATHRTRETSAAGLVALDLWHGSRKRRKYTSRLDHFEGVADVAQLVQTDAQGILEFRPKVKAAEKMNATICAYFVERADDAVSDKQ